MVMSRGRLLDARLSMAETWPNLWREELYTATGEGLLWAVDQGDEVEVRLLLIAKGCPDFRGSPAVGASSSGASLTPLEKSAKEGNLPMMKLLLEGIDAPSLVTKNSTPLLLEALETSILDTKDAMDPLSRLASCLHKAVEYSRAELLSYLLEKLQGTANGLKGALGAVDRHGQSLLHLACGGSSVDLCPAVWGVLRYALRRLGMEGDAEGLDGILSLDPKPNPNWLPKALMAYSH